METTWLKGQSNLNLIPLQCEGHLKEESEVNC